ncbi:S1C family serine protease [Uliginosibacterium sp. H1]|uniref:S1C family serine protease n=1 Tax=Uliginosibacterium sp. H1 TaxID=3114757 RepID=UPI002E19F550|nr:trypsin-like peptidase domain-containing protein [Uliginosibacterium sp. H1]
MKRVALYSKSGRTQSAASTQTVAATQAAAPPPSSAAAAAAQSPPPRPRRFARLRNAAGRHRGLLLFVGGMAAVLAGLQIDRHYISGAPREITQRDIDQAVRTSLEKKPLPSQATKAAMAIGPSIVRVLGHGMPDGEEVKSKAAKPPLTDPKKDGNKARPKGQAESETEENTAIGTGVVITERGDILTNLHVVAGSRRITLTFADGTEAGAYVVAMEPEHDLAVLRATKLPDDLQPATLRSTGDLAPGDEVIAVGFPFGFGPSVSSGVVSGLKREFRSPKGEKLLTNLIQFDAAANPGNSGGPLVTMEGEVVGIVTAIVNPSGARVFAGVGFAVPIENAAGAIGVPPF